MRTAKPKLKIFWYETGSEGYPVKQELGPFYSAKPIGHGKDDVQGWISYEVLDEQLHFYEVIVPSTAGFSAIDYE